RGGASKDVNTEAGTLLRESINFGDSNENRPTIGFFASNTAAQEFEGTLDTIIFGGGHKFGFEQTDNTTAIEVGALGAGFPRVSGSPVSDYSNVAIVELTKRPNGIELANCVQARWDPFDASESMEITSCD